MNYINFNDINEIHIEVSSRCRLKCLHCSSHSMIMENKNYYNLEDIENFLKVFKSSQCHLYITGGEPLLAAEIYDIIAKCKSLGFKVGLFTTFNTGDDIEQLLSRLNKAGLDDFYVSLYDCCADQHDNITQIKGSFLNSLYALTHAKSFKISPKINFVLLKSNIFRLENNLNSLDLLKTDEIRILKLVKHGNAMSNWETIGIETQQQYQAVQNILSKRFDTRITVSGFPSIRNCRPFESKWPCGANKTLLYIDNKGDIYPCASQKNQATRRIGTIFDPSHIIQHENNSACFSDEF